MSGCSVPATPRPVPTPSPEASLLARDRVRLRRALLHWFDTQGRSLAFRGATTPYGVLVAEVMAQQTQVSRVEPAWLAFMAAFPTPAALATAPIADVLRAWAGLGYNRRAVNLQRAARTILVEHGGHVPADPVALERLPGIGPYTARAVAAIAFGAPVAAVDTNVRRVVTRLLSTGEGDRDGADLQRGLSTAEVQAVAHSLVDPARPGDWTHAMMDVGATLCRPARVECAPCPLRPSCGYATARDSESGSAGPERAAPPDRAERLTSGRAPAPGRARPFVSTRRWLRGRLVALLCAAPDGTWHELRTPLGEHSTEAAADALTALAREGLVERDDDGRVRLAR